MNRKEGKSSDWNLSNFSDMLAEQSARREEERKVAEAARGEPQWFEADGETEGHGIGYFASTQGVVAYRRHSNGYELYPCAMYRKEWVEKLAQLLKEASA